MWKGQLGKEQEWLWVVVLWQELLRLAQQPVN
jgi:hypothetical protein